MNPILKTISHFGAGYRLQFRGKKEDVTREVNRCYNYGLITCAPDQLKEQETPNYGEVLVEATSHIKAFAKGVAALAHGAARQAMIKDKLVRKPSIFRELRKNCQESILGSFRRVENTRQA